MTTHGRAWLLFRPVITVRFPGMNPCHTQDGGFGDVWCCVCHWQGNHAHPLGRCCCCRNWACVDHLVSPVCLDGYVPMCPFHPQLEHKAESDFSWLRRFWE
eukprot:2425215-Amphidinium_carterae.1